MGAQEVHVTVGDGTPCSGWTRVTGRTDGRWLPAPPTRCPARVTAPIRSRRSVRRAQPRTRVPIRPGVSRNRQGGCCRQSAERSWWAEPPLVRSPRYDSLYTIPLRQPDRGSHRRPYELEDGGACFGTRKPAVADPVKYGRRPPDASYQTIRTRDCAASNAFVDTSCNRILFRRENGQVCYIKRSTLNQHDSSSCRTRPFAPSPVAAK